MDEETPDYFTLGVDRYDGEIIWFAEGHGRPYEVFLAWLATQSLGISYWSDHHWCAWTFTDPRAVINLQVKFGAFFQSHSYGPWYDFYHDGYDFYGGIPYDHDDDPDESTIWSNRIRVWEFRCNSTSPMWCTTSRPRPRSERHTGNGRGWQKSSLRRFSFAPYSRSGKITAAPTVAYIRILWSGRNKGRRLSMS